MNRREFLINGTLITLGTGAMMKTGFGLPLMASEKSKAVEIFNPNAVNTDRVINQAVVNDMLHQGLAELTGKDDLPLSTFIKPSDVVGLKINCLGRAMLHTHKEIINSTIAELKAVGVKENNIIVWDRFGHHMTSCGFTLNDSTEGVRYMATERRKEDMYLFDENYSYISDEDNPERRDDDGNISRFSSLITETCDKIINLAILKDHGLAGVTLCLKNISYGICNNNGRFHGPQHIGTFISDVYALPEIREKVVLNIIDGLEGCYEQGPVPKSPDVIFTPKTIWLSTDPVALDSIGLGVIEAQRKKQEIPSLFEIRHGTNHIEIASLAGLGNHDPDLIDISRLELS